MRLALLIGSVVALGGCATGNVSMLATISGGEKIAVPLGRGGVEPTKRNGVQIENVFFTLNEEKKLVYRFGFSDANARAMRRVRVEDVSDAAPALLVELDEPALENGGWQATSRPYTSSEPHLAWMSTITNTLRVFRFTITFADGRELVLHQGAMFPAFVKSGVRRAWGENY